MKKIIYLAVLLLFPFSIYSMSIDSLPIRINTSLFRNCEKKYDTKLELIIKKLSDSIKLVDIASDVNQFDYGKALVNDFRELCKLEINDTMLCNINFCGYFYLKSEENHLSIYEIIFVDEQLANNFFSQMVDSSHHDRTNSPFWPLITIVKSDNIIYYIYELPEVMPKTATLLSVMWQNISIDGYYRQPFYD